MLYTGSEVSLRGSWLRIPNHTASKQPNKRLLWFFLVIPSLMPLESNYLCLYVLHTVVVVLNLEILTDVSECSSGSTWHHGSLMVDSSLPYYNHHLSFALHLRACKFWNIFWGVMLSWLISIRSPWQLLERITSFWLISVHHPQAQAQLFKFCACSAFPWTLVQPLQKKFLHFYLALCLRSAVTKKKTIVITRIALQQINKIKSKAQKAQTPCFSYGL